MARWLGACAALPEDLSSIPSTHNTPAPQDPTHSCTDRLALQQLKS